MFLVPMPEAGDSDSLLSGPEGKLLASFATAAGLTQESLYWASALPRHTPLPDWDRLAVDGLGDVLLHHIALAAPQRVIVFGRNVSPLLGHDPAQAAPAVSEIAIQSRSVQVLTTYAPGRLLEHPRLRKELWQHWLDWTDEG
jgi:DNA polymerase